MAGIEHDAAAARLDQALDCHDADPARAAELLRGIAAGALPAERLADLAFLLNHVLGEKLGAWDQAHALFAPLLAAAGAAPLPVLWRQAAAAAGLAGDAAAGTRCTEAFAQATATSAAQAAEVVALTQTMYRAPALAAADAGGLLAQALQPFEAPRWRDAATGLDAAVAACANNLASALIERAPDDLRHPALRAAARQAAEIAERCWLRAGTWVHHERAAYLRSLVANALGEPAEALGHALRALAILDADDRDQAEAVDRAFILLEASRARRALGDAAAAGAALAAADEIAAGFAGDAGLAAWYAERRAASA